MGVDAVILARLDEPLPERELIRVSKACAWGMLLRDDELGGAAFALADLAYPRVPSGALYELNHPWRYYSRSYPRGPLPLIATAFAMLRRILPAADLYYAPDTGDEPEPWTEQLESYLWDCWVDDARSP